MGFLVQMQVELLALANSPHCQIWADWGLPPPTIWIEWYTHLRSTLPLARRANGHALGTDRSEHWPTFLLPQRKIAVLNRLGVRDAEEVTRACLVSTPGYSGNDGPHVPGHAEEPPLSAEARKNYAPPVALLLLLLLRLLLLRLLLCCCCGCYWQPNQLQETQTGPRKTN